MCIVKYSLVFLLILGIASCSTDATTENSAVSSNESSLNGKFIRVKDNKRAGMYGKLISEIEFRNEHCHFTYVGTKMSGKYSVDEGFVYIYTGSDLGTLSMEIVSKNQLEGEGYIHGTFKKDGTFVPEENIKKNKINYPEANKNKTFSNPENQKEPFKTSTNQADNPFGNGGSDGKNEAGSGGPFGDTKGTGGSEPDGSGSGEGRIRLSDPHVEHISTNVNVTIYLKVTINEDGNVVSAISTSKTTTTDQRIINQVIAAVKSQVKYNKDPGASLATTFLTVKVNAT